MSEPAAGKGETREVEGSHLSSGKGRCACSRVSGEAVDCVLLWGHIGMCGVCRPSGLAGSHKPASAFSYHQGKNDPRRPRESCSLGERASRGLK